MEEEQIRTVENLELASCNSPVNFNCEKCKYSAKSSTGLKTHMKAKHVVDKKKKHKNIPQLDGFEDLNIYVGAQTDFVCGKCDFITENNDMLINHISTEHKKYQCWDCEYSTDQRYSIRKRQCYHIKSVIH